MSASIQHPYIYPQHKDFVPQWLRHWPHLFFAFWFQMSGVIYGGVVTHFMGETCLKREDVMMILLCGVVGLNLPFPIIFRMKAAFPNRSNVICAALAVGLCNIGATLTHCVPLLCAMAFVAGFFKLVGTFECNSSVQLWITHKRDFTIFFPAIYSFVIGNMSLSPWLSLQLAYIYQDWRAMSYLVAGVMFLIALYYYTCIRPYRPLRFFPFLSIDFLGMALWAAVMIEIIFIFNYGEFYNWWNGFPIRLTTLLVPLTLFCAIQRMRHIHHPYITPGTWLYKRLIPLTGLFIMVEILSSVPKVLQNRFLGNILHYGIMQTADLYLVEVVATLFSMAFIVFWAKQLKLLYTRLLTVATLCLFVYVVMLYFLVQPGLPLQALYMPVFFRAFGNAMFFTVFNTMIYDMTRMEHFFACITVAGLIRNGVGESIGSGLYSFGMRHHIVENLSRALPYDHLQSTLVSIKELYGVTAVLLLCASFAFLLWNIQPVKRTVRKVPYWLRYKLPLFRIHGRVEARSI